MKTAMKSLLKIQAVQRHALLRDYGVILSFKIFCEGTPLCRPANLVEKFFNSVYIKALFRLTLIINKVINTKPATETVSIFFVFIFFVP